MTIEGEKDYRLVVTYTENGDSSFLESGIGFVFFFEGLIDAPVNEGWIYFYLDGKVKSPNL